ncbi:MAG: hypothetical protein QGD89_04480 [Actinomycetota bacterium]|nr:hypothetical protein [Actinomycetota bacterium]
MALTGSHGSPDLEASVVRTVPLHWGSTAVPAQAVDVRAPRVSALPRCDLGLGHAELVTVVEERGPAKSEEKESGDAGVALSEAGRHPDLVVVAEVPVGPA